MMKYKCFIRWIEYGKYHYQVYEFYANSFEEVKKEFLKRFGNLTRVPNNVLKEKSKVKQITHDAKDVRRWAYDVSTKCRYIGLIVRYSEGRR